MYFILGFNFLQPIFSAISTMSSFATRYTELELENNRLHQELAISIIAQEQIGKANQLAEEAWQQNEDLKKELLEAKAELEKATKLREQEKAAAEEAAKRLSKSIESLLGKCQFVASFLYLADEYVITLLSLCSRCCRCSHQPG